MRLLINTALLRFGGAVQVASSFIDECRRFPKHEYDVVLGPGVGAVLDTSNYPDNFRFHRKTFGVMGLRKAPIVQREMSAIERELRPDCVATTSGPAYWRSERPHLMGFNLPLLIYPESPYFQRIPLKKKLRFSVRNRLHRAFFRRDADALLVQTDDVNRRVRKLLGTNAVHTVTNTHSAWFDDPPARPQRLPERKEGIFRLLTVSSYYSHKNLDIIPALIRELPERLRCRVEFVLTLTEEIFRERIAADIPEQVRLVGPVPPPDCPSLYMECDAMFLPTLAECFSASYPEAMKMGKPIITTDLGFARSICQDAALYFTACDARDAARQVEKLIDDRALQDDLRQRGRARLAAFDTPARRAEKILDICKGLIESPQGRADQAVSL